MLSLDVRHKTHNIPGKFLTYISSGLPVLASVNPGNDLISLIESRGTGRVVSDGSVISLIDATNELVDLINADGVRCLSESCITLRDDLFRPETAAKKIVAALGY